MNETMKLEREGQCGDASFVRSNLPPLLCELDCGMWYPYQFVLLIYIYIIRSIHSIWLFFCTCAMIFSFIHSHLPISQSKFTLFSHPRPQAICSAIHHLFCFCINIHIYINLATLINRARNQTWKHSLTTKKKKTIRIATVEYIILHLLFTIRWDPLTIYNFNGLNRMSSTKGSFIDNALYVKNQMFKIQISIFYRHLKIE
jgi:hypothetical protein